MEQSPDFPADAMGFVVAVSNIPGEKQVRKSAFHSGIICQRGQQIFRRAERFCRVPPCFDGYTVDTHHFIRQADSIFFRYIRQIRINLLFQYSVGRVGENGMNSRQHIPVCLFPFGFSGDHDPVTVCTIGFRDNLSAMVHDKNTVLRISADHIPAA